LARTFWSWVLDSVGNYLKHLSIFISLFFEEC
jgi:hypothetical protein